MLAEKVAWAFAEALFFVFFFFFLIVCEKKKERLASLPRLWGRNIKPVQSTPKKQDVPHAKPRQA